MKTTIAQATIRIKKDMNLEISLYLTKEQQDLLVLNKNEKHLISVVIKEVTQ